MEKVGFNITPKEFKQLSKWSKNIYNIDKVNVIGYLIVVELIFCLVSSFIFVIFYFINNLKIMLYICILFIFICGLINPKIDKNN